MTEEDYEDLVINTTMNKIHILWMHFLCQTNVASMFTLNVFDCRDVILIVVASSKYVGNFDHRSNFTWSFE